MCSYLAQMGNTSMLDAQDMLRVDLSDDGLHPNTSGYRIMAPLATAAIQQALR
jgi:lysophospholipase L1-like esterase